MSNNGEDRDNDGPEAKPLKLPPLRAFKVTKEGKDGKDVEVVVMAHGVTHETSGAVSFVEAVWEEELGLTQRIRRSIRYWGEIEEMPVSKPSVILH